MRGRETADKHEGRDAPDSHPLPVGRFFAAQISVASAHVLQRE